MRSILIVDDRPTNRHYLATVLGFTGCRLLEAGDGAHALALVRAEKPDLIITDILMPTMDGYEFVQQLRADPELRRSRVIFFSATYSPRETAAIAKSCGVETVLSKPSDPHTILSAVQAELGMVGRDSSASVHTISGWPRQVEDLSGMFANDLGGQHSMLTRLLAMEELSLRLIGERDVEQMIASFLNACGRLLDADYSALCLLDNAEENARHVAADGFDVSVLGPHPASRLGLPGSMMLEEKPLNLLGAARLSQALPDAHPHISHLLGLAIRDDQHLYGWLYVARKQEGQAFGDADSHILQALAGKLAMAYENLNLFETVQRHAALLQLEANARTEADQALRASEERFRAMTESAPDAIIAFGQDQRILHFNRAAEQLFGYACAEVLHQSVKRLLPPRLHNVHDVRFQRHQHLRMGRYIGQVVEVRGMRKNGEEFTCDLALSVVQLHGQALYTAILRDTSQKRALKEAHNQLAFLSYHDALTQLPNRALLNDSLDHAIAAVREGHEGTAVLLFNIDRLQRINDSLGHAAGDQLLVSVATRARQLAGRDDILAHLGSDEFALVMGKCEDTDAVILMARRLIEEISQPISVAGRDVVVTISIGIALFPRDGANSAELLKAADTALSHVKEKGRNGFRFFTCEMNAHAERWLALETQLRRALEAQELSLHYQPQVSVASGHVVSVEALIRWTNPQLGKVAPADFIPLAEDTGLIQPIGDWVLRQACLTNKAWQDAGLAPVRVAVNVSGHQFMAGTVPASVRAALAASGLAPAWLEIELTETVMMRDTDATQRQLAELSAMGVSVALDDFGTGYSSLGYLSRFTLDKLKIDQSFVRDITTEPRSAAIAQATISLAHGLKLAVVAEGVENLGQFNYLRRIGCDEVQGYLFSHPVPADDMAKLLSEGCNLKTSRN